MLGRRDCDEQATGVLRNLDDLSSCAAEGERPFVRMKPRCADVPSIAAVNRPGMVSEAGTLITRVCLTRCDRSNHRNTWGPRSTRRPVGERLVFLPRSSTRSPVGLVDRGPPEH